MLNQIPNAISNIFLIQNKQNIELYRFNHSYIDKCISHLIFEFELATCFRARAIAFCLIVTPARKFTKPKTKKKKNNKNNNNNLILLYFNVLILSFVGILLL